MGTGGGPPGGAVAALQLLGRDGQQRAGRSSNADQRPDRRIPRQKLVSLLPGHPRHLSISALAHIHSQTCTPFHGARDICQCWPWRIPCQKLVSLLPRHPGHLSVSALAHTQSETCMPFQGTRHICQCWPWRMPCQEHVSLLPWHSGHCHFSALAHTLSKTCEPATMAPRDNYQCPPCRSRCVVVSRSCFGGRCKRAGDRPAVNMLRLCHV